MLSDFYFDVWLNMEQNIVYSQDLCITMLCSTDLLATDVTLEIEIASVLNF